MPSKYKTKQQDRMPRAHTRTTLLKPCACGKVRYETQAEADRAIILQQRANTPTLYTYLCLQCFGFHWTSKKPNQNR